MKKTHLSKISFLLSLIMVLSFAGCGFTHFTLDGLKIAELTPASTTYHTAVAENYTATLKSGLYQLMYDKTTASIGVKDTSGAVWYSLPTEQNTIGAMLSMQVTDGAKLYNLNSSDNSVAYGTSSIKSNDGSIEITYKMQDKASNPKFSIPVTMKFSLQDGQLIVTVDAAKIDMGKMTLISLSIMPTFGAVSQPAAGDFIVIPDGCGGKIDLATASDAKYCLDVYGTDPKTSDENPHPALFGVYGMKRGNSAFAGIITSGDTIAQVNAEKSNISYANVTFNYPKSEVLSISYKFISGSLANYTGIASMCREQFTRDGKLSTRSANSTSLVPVAITVRGNSRSKFENVEDIANVLKVKGVNSQIFKYENAISKNKLASNLGSKNEFLSLDAYFRAQGLKLYLCMDYLDCNVSLFTKEMKSYNPQGYCITDVGNELTSTKTSTRKEMLDSISKNTISLSTNKGLMVENGNIYTLKNANIVSGIPMTTTYEESTGYSAIPFLQMILHGTVEYTSANLNEMKESEREKAVLKCIEYGAIPSLRMSFDNDSEYFYDDYTTDALTLYNKFNSVLKDLGSEKITGHKMLQSGLYMTEYNNGSYVYVNYTGKAISYNGITVKAMSFLRVN